MQLNPFSTWVIENYIEILGTLTGLLYLFFQVKEHILLWFFGLICSGIYIYVFYTSKIYADMALNVYYFGISIYGWIHWTIGKNPNQPKLPVTRLDNRLFLKLLAVNLVLFVLIYIILENFTDSDVSVIDSFTTSASIVATWMLARKILEHWLFWIIIDAVSAGLYIYKELYPTVFLFIVYTIIAFIGFLSWKKTWQKEQIIAG